MKTALKIAVVVAVIAVAALCAALAIQNHDASEHHSNYEPHSYSIICIEDATITSEDMTRYMEQTQTDSMDAVRISDGAGASVILNNSALSQMDPTKDATFKVVKIDIMDLTVTQRNLIGLLDVFDISLGDNHDFSKGAITISIPYTLKNGENADNIYVFALVGDSLERHDCFYADGYVTFDTTHLSVYGVKQDVETGGTAKIIYKTSSGKVLQTYEIDVGGKIGISYSMEDQDDGTLYEFVDAGGFRAEEQFYMPNHDIIVTMKVAQIARLVFKCNGDIVFSEKEIVGLKVHFPYVVSLDEAYIIHSSDYGGYYKVQSDKVDFIKADNYVMPDYDLVFDAEPAMYDIIYQLEDGTVIETVNRYESSEEVIPESTTFYNKEDGSERGSYNIIDILEEGYEIEEKFRMPAYDIHVIVKLAVYYDMIFICDGKEVNRIQMLDGAHVDGNSWYFTIDGKTTRYDILSFDGISITSFKSGWLRAIMPERDVIVEVECIS